MKRKFGFAKKISGGAYSLIELSIVLVIISVLIAGAMTVSVENLKTDRERITKERMDKIYKALGSYLRLNEDLPCPAPLNKVRSVDSDYGTEGGCTAVSGGVVVNGDRVWGAVPVYSLGLSTEFAEDGFGSKMIYFVEKRFTSAASLNVAPDFTVDNFSTMASAQLSSATPVDLWIIQSRQAGALQDVTRNAVLGIVSLGQNKLGAYNGNSSASTTTSSDTDEATNYGASTTFVSSSPASSSFDDLVSYKTMKDIIADNPDLMSLVPCNNNDSRYINGSNTGDTWYDGTVYSKKAVCDSPNQELRFSKKCGSNGAFVIQNESCAVTGSSTCSMTNGQDVGTGAEYVGTTQAYPNGTLIPLSCRANFGRAIIGGSRTSDNTTQTCSLSPTDRSTTSFPQAICSNGTLYVLNDCTACRGCSNNDATSAIVVNDVTVTASMSCNSDSRLASSILNDCRNNGIGYTLVHGASATFGHVKERRCNCPCQERNVCNAATLQCLDGYFSFTAEPDYDLGGDTSCDSPTIHCPPNNSQSCGNGC